MNKKIFSIASGAVVLSTIGLVSTSNIKAESQVPIGGPSSIELAGINFSISYEGTGEFINPLINNNNMNRIVETTAGFSSAASDEDGSGDYYAYSLLVKNNPVGGRKKSADDNIVVAQSAKNIANLTLTPNVPEEELKYIDISIKNTDWTDSALTKNVEITVKNKLTHKESTMTITDEQSLRNTIWTDSTGQQTTNNFVERYSTSAKYENNQLKISSVYEYYPMRILSAENSSEYASEVLSDSLITQATIESDKGILFVFGFSPAQTYNNNPVINSIGAVSNQNFTNKDNTIKISGQTADEDGDVLNVSISVDDTKIGTTTTNSTGAFETTINTKDLSVGKHKITVSVDDGFGGKASKDIEFNVVNNVPSISATSKVSSIREGDNLDVDISITDKDIGQTLSVVAEIIDKDGAKTSKTLGEVTSTGQEINKTYTIPLSEINLKENCSINISVSDSIESANIKSPISVTILPPKVKPTITVTEKSNNQSVPFSNKGEIINISGTYADENVEDTITIAAKIDDTIIPSEDITVNTDGIYFVAINTASLSIGNHNVTITASDGELTSETVATIIILNSKPSITVSDIGEIAQGGKFNLNVAAIDENDGQDITISYAIDDGEPKDLETFSSVGTNNKTYTLDSNGLDVGSHKITVSVTDDSGETASSEVDFSIIYKSEAPSLQLNTISDRLYSLDNKSLTVSGLCYDINGDKISLDIYFDGEKISSIDNLETTDDKFSIPLNFDMPITIGSHKIKVVASDGQLKTTKEISFNITNTAPVISAQVESEYYIDNAQTISIPLNIKDENKGQNITISYSLDNNEEKEFTSFSSSNNDDKILEINSSNLTIGSHTLIIKCTDGIETTSITKTFKTNYSPQPPVIEGNDKYEFSLSNAQNQIDLKVSDINNDDISIKIEIDGIKVPSAYFDFTNNNLSIYIPSLKYGPGEHQITVTATDSSSENNSSSKDITFTMKNTAPVLNVGSVESPIKLGTIIDIPVEVVDNDFEQELTTEYCLDNSDVFIAINKSPISIDTTNLAIGEHSIKIRTSDGYDTVEKIISFSIYKENQAPALNINSINNQTKESETEPNFDISITGQVSDADNNDLTVSYVLTKDGKEIDRGTVSKVNGNTSVPSNIDALIPSLKAGNYSITFTASDGELETIKTFNFVLEWKKIETPKPDPTPDPTPTPPPTPNPPPTNNSNYPKLYITDVDGTVVSIYVSDKDIDEKVNIYCEIDKESKQKLISFKAKEKGFKYEFDLAEYLTPGEHTIVFYAIDSDGNYSNEDGDILFKDKDDEGNKIKITVDEINSVPSLFLNSPKTEFEEKSPISIPITVRDSDVGQTLNIFYQVDDLFPNLYTTITAGQTEQNMNIEIPAMSEGTHTIHVYAVDAANAQSKPDAYYSVSSAINNYLGGNTLSDVVKITIVSSKASQEDTTPSTKPSTKPSIKPSTTDTTDKNTNTTKPSTDKINTGVITNTHSVKTPIAAILGLGLTAVAGISLGKKHKK